MGAIFTLQALVYFFNLCAKIVYSVGSSVAEAEKKPKQNKKPQRKQPTKNQINQKSS